MPKLTLATALPTLFAVFFLAGCGGPESKCSKAFDNATDISLSMLEGIAGLAALGGEDGKAKMEEAKKAMKEAVASKKPDAVKACVKAIKDDPAATKAVECVANADGVAGLEKCSGADFLKGAFGK